MYWREEHRYILYRIFSQRSWSWEQTVEISVGGLVMLFLVPRMTVFDILSKIQTEKLQTRLANHHSDGSFFYV